MARPQYKNDWRDFHDGSGGDWEALRSDLVALLDQVDQEIPGRTQPEKRQPVLERPASYEPRSRNTGVATDRAQDNPQAILQAAIDDIRARTQEIKSVGRVSPSQRLRPQSRDDAWDTGDPHGYGREIRDHIAGINSAVMSLSERLEHVEEQLHDARTSGTEIGVVAQQVEQLVGVVEMLAGAVGETGQVKRLEGQINRLAELVSKGNKSEINTLTKRIDDVASTVDRLAGLQADQIERSKQVAVQPQSDNAEALRAEVMRAMEDGVRGIYDRIDTMEKRYALSTSEVERLTGELSAFTQEMRGLQSAGEANPEVLEKLDVLTQHLAQIEQSSGNASAVRDIRGDVTALRATLSDAFEQRFNDLQNQIGSLSSKLASGNDIDVSTLEAQITQLAKRMEQTGEKIDGLQRNQTSTGQAEAPDFEALATLVASRTSEEFQRRHGGGLSEDSISAIEARLSRMFEAREPEKSPEQIEGVRADIKQVDARLGRLEAALTKRMRASSAGQARSGAAQPAAKAETSVNPGQTAPKQPEIAAGSAVHGKATKPEVTDAVSQIKTAPPPQSAKAAGDDRWAELDDLMPRSPAKDAPLKDKSFGEAPLELPSTLSDEPELHQNRAKNKDKSGPQHAGPKNAAPAITPETIERPEKPKSRFSDDPPAGFSSVAPHPVAPDQGQSRPVSSLPGTSGERAPTADRNTFIAAARRAAMRQAEEQSQTDEGSLIGRAFARLNTTKLGSSKEEKKAEPVAPSTPIDDELSGRHSYELEDNNLEDGGKPGFLARYKRPLLLGTALVIVCVLTVNLIAQRMTSSEPSAPATVESSQPAEAPQVPEATTNTPEQTAPVEAEVPDTSSAETDPAPTGSIDPMVQMSLTDPAPTYQHLPMALTSSTDQPRLSSFETGSVNPAGEQPSAVKVELPPENVGSLDLREAAADGDPRAQFEIGAIYSEGQIVAKDFEAAAKWYERAAAQGFAPAQYRLGTLYEHGRGVQQDLQQSRLWYQRAADAGNRMAMHNLAALYASGDLGKQDFAAAADWFGRAAERGMVDSQFNLGMLYARGLGVTQDLEQSYKWFGLAAEQGDEDALKARDDIARSLDASAIAKAQDEIDNWTITSLDIAANFAPIGAWSEDFDPGTPIKDRDVIKKVQTALSKLGYDIGEPDGLLGPKTRDAIKTFERSAGMSEVGLVNPRLLAVLGSQPV